MKRGSIPPTFIFPAIAVGSLVLGFLYYYFPARIQREDALNRQAFRQLGTVADLIQNAVSNYANVLERWAIADVTGGNLEGFTDQVPDLHYVPLAAAGSRTIKVNTRSDPGQVLLVFEYGGHGADIPLETLVQRYIQGDPNDTFDEFLVTDTTGAVLYQTRRTGLHLRSLSTVLASIGGDKKTDDKSPAVRLVGTAQQTSDVVKVSLGGAGYRIYSCPAPIRIRQTDDKPALDLVLYGLVSEASVHARALATPGSVQITVGLIVALVLFIAWPLLKFRTMRASERVPRGAALYFFLSSIVTIALLMILSIHLWYRTSDFDGTRTKLEQLAEAIDNNLARETRQALDALDQAMTSRKFLDTASHLETHETVCGLKEHPTAAGPETYTIKQSKGSVLAWRDFPVAGYPYFDQMLWVDKNGFQQIKWTVRSHATPATRLCQYPFFTETLEGHLWYFVNSGPTKKRFRIDPIFSPNTGEYQAMISQPYEQPAGQPVLQRPPIAMVAMVTQMISLINPVVPPDFGFAMVDESGKVLFHSTAGRNGREQLFDEVGNDPAARAAVFTQTGGHLITDYHGAPHRFFVRSLRLIQGCPWTLVTFRDLRPLSALQLERTILLLVLSVGYLVLACLFAVIFLRPGIYPRDWVWPKAGQNATYVHITLSMVALAALMYAVVIWASLLVSFLAALATSLIGIRIVTWKLQGRDLHIRALAYVLLAALSVVVLWEAWRMRDLRWCRVGPLLLTACLVLQFCGSPWITAWLARKRRNGWPRLPDFGTSFTAMGLSVLLLVPTLPCVAFFRIAYDYQENLFTRQAQLQTMSALGDRVERILHAYAKVMLTDLDGRVNDVFRASFLRARIDDVRLDRYDTAFMGDSGQEYSPAPPSPDTGTEDSMQERESRFSQPLQFAASLWGDPYSSAARFLNHRYPSTRWKWEHAGDRNLRMRPRFVLDNQNASADSPPTAALARLVANNPVLLSEDLVSELQVLKPGFFEAALPLFLFGGFMYLLFSSTVTRMFLLRIQFQSPWPETTFEGAIAEDRSLILMGLPRSGKTAALDELRRSGRIHYINLAEMVPKCLAAESAKLRVQRNPVAEPVIVLDHFEFNCQLPEANRVKLEILEWLAHEPGKRVLIVTAIDPEFYLHRGPIDDAGSPEGFAPGEYLDRWMAALASFDLRRLPLPTMVRNSYYHQFLWTVCSRSERVALYQLARDGWPNHQNWRALDHLLKRGLIERTPVIRFVDEDFRNYVCTVVGPADVTLWEREESITVWDGIRIAFYILALGGVVAVSVYHQQEVLAVFTTLVGIVPALGKLFSGMGRGDKAAKGGAA